METLSKYQYRTLLKLANGSIKIQAIVAGVAGEAGEDKVNFDFNSILRLAELKLVKDVTERYIDSPIFAQYQKDERDFAVISLTNRGQWMFERAVHDKWVN